MLSVGRSTRLGQGEFSGVLRLSLPEHITLGFAEPIPAPTAIEADGTIRWD